MKLRYYLRGLGIGMLVAALVLILSGNTGGRMSDEAVKRRASELGMVEKDKSVLGNIEGGEVSGEEAGTKPSGSEEETVIGDDEKEPAEEDDSSKEQEAGERGDLSDEKEAGGSADISDAQKSGEIPGLSGTAENKEAANPSDAQKETGNAASNEEQDPAGEIEQRSDEVVGRAEEVAENAVPGRVLTFEVRRGDSSISVARRAEEMGLVTSAADFDVFLCQNGYDKRISIGSYEIVEGASQKEIADKITKSN